MKLSLVIIIIIITGIFIATNLSAQDSLVVKSNQKDTYTRTSGSVKVQKEYNYNSTHNPDKRKVYNNSVKHSSYVDSNPVEDTTQKPTVRTNSVRSFRFKSKRKPILNENSDNVSPFRSNKHRR